MTKPNGPSLLNVRDVRREYPTPGEPLVVLNGITFSLERGESMAIMGPSGSGKSTLLHIIGTLDRPTSGEVRIEGADPFTFPPNEIAAFRNRTIGFVFQEHYLLPQCSVLENVLVPTLVGNGDPTAIEKRARELIEKVGLSGRLDHRPAELSGGERQRVAVARAMINSPSILLCDEPTGNLDRRSAESIGSVFKQLQAEGTTGLVVVTHSGEFAVLFDRVYNLIDGKLEAESEKSQSIKTG